MKGEELSASTDTGVGKLLLDERPPFLGDGGRGKGQKIAALAVVICLRMKS